MNKPNTCWHWLSYRDALDWCTDRLSQPPHAKHVMRIEPKGHCKFRCVLPLELCPTTNKTRHTSRWSHNQRMVRLRNLMSAQALACGWHVSFGPLPGRPQVICIRFSTRRPDRFGDWAKEPVDLLTSKNNGLNFIRDDSDLHCDLYQTWEPSGKRGVGCCLIEVWTNPESLPLSSKKEGSNDIPAGF